MKKNLLYIAAIILTLNIISQSQTVMLDPSFGSNGIAIFSPGTLHDVAYDVMVLPDTSMLICGVGKFNGSSAGLLMRILNDGSQDMTFGTSGISVLQFGTSTYAYNLAVQQDGKIIISGICYVTVADAEFFTARFLANGTPDSTFGTNGYFLTSYGTTEEVCYAMAIQNDGKIILAGRTNPPFALLFTRINTDGSLDNSFGTNGYTVIDATIQQEAIRAMDFLNDGTIVSFGYGYQSTPYFGEKVLMAKLDTSGMPLTGFGNNGVLFPSVFNDISTVYGLKVKNDSLFVTGYIYDEFNDYVLFVSKLDQDGNAILTFGTNGITVTKQSPNDHVNVGYDLKISDDGKIYVCGTSGFGALTYPRDFILLRYMQNGLPDTSFTSTGYIITSIGPDWDEANALDFQNDGKVVLAGFKSGYSTTGNNYIAIARYLVNDLLFPFIAVAPNPIVFDTTDVGSTSQEIMQVLNTGSAPLNVYDIFITDSVFTSPVNSFTIYPGESEDVPINFQPNLPGNYSGFIQIVSNASNSDTISIPVSGVAQYPTGVNGEQQIPRSFSLYDNYPNPFNPSTKICFEIPKNGEVSLRVFDLVGREVVTLINQTISKGSYEVEFKAEGLPSGVYFYQLRAGNFVETKKMILMK